MTNEHEQQDQPVDVREVIAEMDELGRAKWDVAVERWQNRKLRARLAEVENQSAPTGPRAVDNVDAAGG